MDAFRCVSAVCPTGLIETAAVRRVGLRELGRVRLGTDGVVVRLGGASAGAIVMVNTIATREKSRVEEEGVRVDASTGGRDDRSGGTSVGRGG